MPPITDQKAHQTPSRKARLRSATIIGSSITSGGIGKNDASAKAKQASATQACGPLAFFSIQAYSARRPRGWATSGMGLPERGLLAAGRGLAKLAARPCFL